MQNTDSRLATHVVLMFVVLTVPSCQRARVRDDAPEVVVDLTIKPDPPKVGDAATTIRLTDKAGKPVEGAAVKLEGNMNHPGMKPAFADAKETQPGSYEATLSLSMGGDWFILVEASLADGRKLKRKVDVPGVRSR
jgi:hypothetical protein